jgi:hypothetical protein
MNDQAATSSHDMPNILDSIFKVLTPHSFTTRFFPDPSLSDVRTVALLHVLLPGHEARLPYLVAAAMLHPMPDIMQRPFSHVDHFATILKLPEVTAG